MNTCYYVLVHLRYIVYGTSVIIIYPISKLNTCTMESVEFVLTHIGNPQNMHSNFSIH